MSNFDQQLANGLETIRGQKGRPITYFAGDDPSDEVSISQAVIGALKTFHRDQQVVESRDFLIKASDLVDGDGDQIVPVAGHRIHEEHDGQRHIYEVAAKEDEPFWRWADPLRTTRRVHTIFIKTENI